MGETRTQSMSTSFDPKPIVLAGTHVRLEPLAQEHAAGLFEAGKVDDIWQFMPFPPLKELADAKRFIQIAHDERDAGRELPFATVDAQSGKVIGSTRYLDIRKPHRGLEIGGTWLTPSAQRTPINTEAKRLLLAHAFEVLGALRVQLKTDALNERSQAAIARLGATREGTLRNHMLLYSGRMRDTVYFSIIDTEWPAVRATLDRMLVLR